MLNIELSRYRSGADFVAAKNDLDRHREQLPDWTKFLIVEDEVSDAKVLRGVLHTWLGYEISVSIAESLGGAIDHLGRGQPDVLFLDHLLPPQSDAAIIIPNLRNAGYDGPIIVVSGMMTLSLRRTLVKAGAFEALHKDNINSMNIGEVLIRLAGVPTGS